MLVKLTTRIFVWQLLWMYPLQTRVVGNANQKQTDEQNLDHPYGSDAESLIVDSTTLRLVQALFRHGDRSPIRAYKNDIYKESDWPQGFGQLSAMGMQQEYELGHYFKQQYVDTAFMNASYRRQEVYVRSTNYDRTLMSAYSVLAGLFPPIGDQVWSKEDVPNWQPIPVHTKPKDEDYLLHTDTECPKYTEYHDNYMKDNEIVKKTVQSNRDLYKYMSENAGEEPTWDGMGQVLDPIFCQYVSNYTMPAWVMVNNTLERLIELTDVYTRVAVPAAVAYLKGGLLVGEMIDHMENKSATKDSQQKMYLYSAHDSTVIALLRTMGIFNDRKPQYTACVIVELHEPIKGDYIVRILYKNETGSEPYILKLHNCDSLCPLKLFHQIMNSSIPSDIKKACGLEVTATSVPVISKEATVAVVVLSSLVLLMLVLGGVLCFMMKKNIRDSHQYSPVPLELT